MFAPYSDELRQKAMSAQSDGQAVSKAAAITAVERGERKTDVSRMLNISRNTLDLWLKRKEQEGKCQALTHYQQGCKHKITEWERFREFVQQHGHKTQGQLARVVGRQRNAAKHQ